MHIYICTYTCMYGHTHIYIYMYISQHMDLSNINALCLGGGTGVPYEYAFPASLVTTASSSENVKIGKSQVQK